MDISVENAIVSAARDLKSEEGENPEYDRALVELASRVLGVDADERSRIAWLIGVEVHQ